MFTIVELTMKKSIHPASLSETDLIAECEIERTRRSGPGGQHRNKVETAVVIRHRPTAILGQASERRSQSENRSEAIERLRVNLAIGIRFPVSETYRPSALWQKRCRNRRISIARRHADFPSLLAEVLDLALSFEFQLNRMAVVLGTTTSQLVRFLALEPKALSWVNDERKSKGYNNLNP